MSTILSTDTVPERERFEYWRETASRVFLGLRIEHKPSEQFFGKLDYREVGMVGVTHLHVAAQNVSRGPSEIARAPREVFFVAMQLEGICTIRQGRDERQTHPGDVELLSGTQPGALSFDTAYRRVVVSVPCPLLLPRLRDPDGAVGLVARSKTGVGALVSAYLLAFTQNQLAEPAAESATDILVDLLALAFNTTGEEARADRPGVREARRHSIRVWAERNLADPSLSPSRAAAQFRLSTRYLHGLFAETDRSFMQWVLSRRVARCAESLSDPAMGHRSIADICEGWGFQDLSHFGRAFKAAYGVTPREFRAAAVARAATAT